MTASDREPAVDTCLPDLAGLSWAELADLDETLAPYRAVVVGQVQRPRVNLGGSGPPGRVD